MHIVCCMSHTVLIMCSVGSVLYVICIVCVVYVCYGSPVRCAHVVYLVCTARCVSYGLRNDTAVCVMCVMYYMCVVW